MASCQFCDNRGSCSENELDCPGIIDPTDNSSCALTPPPEWNCSDAFFGSNDGCDCGCGAVDPDCNNAAVASCQFCSQTGSCNTGSGCPGNIDPVDNGQCEPALPVPAEWTCNDIFFGTNDGCDCGCGAFDPDCTDSDIASCQFCSDTGSCADRGGCPSNIDPFDNSTCSGVSIDGWECPALFFDNGDGCDCGCGIPDPDCISRDSDACDFCNEFGSCNTAATCPGDIDPFDNALCF